MGYDKIVLDTDAEECRCVSQWIRGRVSERVRERKYRQKEQSRRILVAEKHNEEESESKV